MVHWLSAHTELNVVIQNHNTKNTVSWCQEIYPKKEIYQYEIAKQE
jgi:hypothetical protein